MPLLLEDVELLLLEDVELLLLDVELPLDRLVDDELDELLTLVELLELELVWLVLEDEDVELV